MALFAGFSLIEVLFPNFGKKAKSPGRSAKLPMYHKFDKMFQSRERMGININKKNVISHISFLSPSLPFLVNQSCLQTCSIKDRQLINLPHLLRHLVLEYRNYPTFSLILLGLKTFSLLLFHLIHLPNQVELILRSYPSMNHYSTFIPCLVTVTYNTF